jgi:hypothetical protein
MKKIKIIAASVFLIVLGSSILSSSYLNKNCKKYTLTGCVILHKPYCGGAYPTDEITNGYDYKYCNQKFGIVTDSIDRKPVATFTTDDEGCFKVSLTKGHYYIYSASKLVSFEYFFKQNSQKTYNTKPRDKNCFKKWYNTPEFELTITQDTNITITLYEKCFVGLNPCLQYTGPYPP